jgi:hypothetical protein
MDLRAEIEAAKARELDAAEAALAQCFPPPPPLSDEAKQHVACFVTWCDAQKVRVLPAKPTSVAAFVQFWQDRGAPRPVIIEVLASIEALHISAALASPVSSPIVSATLGSTVQPPRSWTKQGKELFATLPLHTQEIIANREQHRERELRRMHNELAELKKRLPDGADKPVINGKETTTMGKKPGEGAYHNNDGDPIYRRETDPGNSSSAKGKNLDPNVTANAERTGGFSAKLTPKD